MMQEEAERTPSGEEQVGAFPSPGARGDLEGARAHDDGLDLPEELFAAPLPSEEDWPEDPAPETRLSASAGRTVAVRILAWALLVEMVLGVAVLAACSRRAAGEIAYWATLGLAGSSSVTAHVVSTDADAENRSRDKAEAESRQR